jgi:hypothetical protein
MVVYEMIFNIDIGPRYAHSQGHRATIATTFILHVTLIYCFSTVIAARPFRVLAPASTYFALQKGLRAQIYISPTLLPRIVVSTFTT